MYKEANYDHMYNSTRSLHSHKVCICPGMHLYTYHLEKTLVCTYWGMCSDKNEYGMLNEFVTNYRSLLLHKS